MDLHGSSNQEDGEVKHDDAQLEELVGVIFGVPCL